MKKSANANGSTPKM